MEILFAEPNYNPESVSRTEGGASCKQLQFPDTHTIKAALKAYLLLNASDMHSALNLFPVQKDHAPMILTLF